MSKETILSKLKDRDIAKKSGNYKLADKIRDELFKQGIVLEDTKNGTIWKKN